jgi:ribonuclease BN (tRNA processing enzyme)
MKLRVLGAFGSEGLGQRPSAFLVNERVLVDAGTAPGALSLAEQLAIEHVLVSHAHLDHIAGLAFLTDTLACRREGRTITVASIDAVVQALRTSIFNDIVWPDFSRIPDPDMPVVQFQTLAEDTQERVGELLVTSVAVNHSVPAVGFIVHDGDHGFVYSGDTGPTDALWKAARTVRGVRGVVLECSFPDRLGKLAGVSGHLTPELVRRELDKLPPDVPVWIFHVKPQFHAEIVEELAPLDGRVRLLEQDKTYDL